MIDTQYKEIKAGQAEFPLRKFPPRDLLRISRERCLTTSLEAFGPNHFNGNVAEMQRQYSHPKTGKKITFRKPTSAESILAASYDFGSRAKPEIFDIRWLQAVRVFKAQEWVVVNPPEDKQGNLITDVRVLKTFLNGITKANGIYSLPNGKTEGVKDCSFVPYESFEQEPQSRVEPQSGEDFARGGLARGLEYVSGVEAPLLGIIINKKNYPRGVRVLGFNPEDKVRVVTLGSGKCLSDGMFLVDGDCWDDLIYGYAFGVLNESAEGASQKK